MLHPREQPAETTQPSGLTGNHLEDGKADTDKQINHDSATLLRACERHSFHCSDLVKATVDAKRGSWDCNVERGLNSGYCGVKEMSGLPRNNESKSSPMSQ